jgi:hypothetical protein
MNVRCRKCGAEWEAERVGVRDECPECAAFVHTCTNCSHYDAGNRDCSLPDTESVRERAGQNFCDEFAYGEPAGSAGPKERPPSADEARRRFEQLFGDAGSE